MQLNPARGRKLLPTDISDNGKHYKVYAAQPREGTETIKINSQPDHAHGQVYAAQPREGTETLSLARDNFVPTSPVYAAQPREGTETCHVSSLCRPGLCSSTPRGDGNDDDPVRHDATIARRFMQLNPARGRKHAKSCTSSQWPNNGLCSSTPRGDGNTLADRRCRRSPYQVYAAQPREGTETCV